MRSLFSLAPVSLFALLVSLPCCSGGGGSSDAAADVSADAGPEVTADIAAEATPDQAADIPSAPFTLTSSAFADGAAMESPYVCASYQDLGVSPPLAWTGAPTGTAAFALTCIDPDGGNWVHWMIWDIPATATSLPEAIPATATTDFGAAQGTNDFGEPGYGGPCPPPGKVHHYVFTLYALDAPAAGLDPAAAKITDLQSFLDAHTLGTAALTGTYEKK
jgi:Raf kinase inhibitor-like YbhB/YbcL family protein